MLLPDCTLTLVAHLHPLSPHHCLGTQYSHQKLTIMFALTERAYRAVVFK